MVVIALLWNLLGLLAIGAELSLSPADIAALPEEQQRLYAARPGWSVIGSVIAVADGTIGCIALLVRSKWSFWLLLLSLVGIILQDIGLFISAGSLKSLGTVPVVLQTLVLVIGVALLLLSRKAQANSWLS